MTGTLYGVSVGSGDAELITLKAVRTIEKCRIIAVPRTGNEKSLALEIAEKSVDMSGKEIVYFDFPMTRDKKILNECHGRIAGIICSYLENEDAAMLCLGDISIYSTFSYIAERIKKAGFKVEYIAGVTSFCSAAALAGISLVTGNQPLTVIPFSCEDFSGLLDNSGIKIIMKCGRNIPELKKILENKNLLDKTYAVENCGLENERIFYGRDIPDSLSYFTVFITR